MSRCFVPNFVSPLLQSAINAYRNLGPGNCGDADGTAFNYKWFQPYSEDICASQCQSLPNLAYHVGFDFSEEACRCLFTQTVKGLNFDLTETGLNGTWGVHSTILAESQQYDCFRHESFWEPPQEVDSGFYSLVKEGVGHGRCTDSSSKIYSNYFSYVGKVFDPRNIGIKECGQRCKSSMTKGFLGFFIEKMHYIGKGGLNCYDDSFHIVKGLGSCSDGNGYYDDVYVATGHLPGGNSVDDCKRWCDSLATENFVGLTYRPGESCYCHYMSGTSPECPPGLPQGACLKQYATLQIGVANDPVQSVKPPFDSFCYPRVQCEDTEPKCHCIYDKNEKLPFGRGEGVDLDDGSHQGVGEINSVQIDQSSFCYKAQVSLQSC